MSKLTWALALVAVLGWGAAYLLWKRPIPQPQTIVQTVDKVETKVVYRETTKPNGTVVKETVTIKQDVKTKTDTKIIPLPKPKWMVGAQILPSLTDKLDYGAELGYRIGESPIWIKTGYNSRRELTLGLSVEF
jgi:hypothetical protein